MNHYWKQVFIICLFLPNYLNCMSQSSFIDCMSPASMSMSSPSSASVLSPSSLDIASPTSSKEIEQKNLFDALLSIKTTLQAVTRAIERGADIDKVYDGNPIHWINSDPSFLNNGDTLIDFATRTGDVNYTRLLLDLGSNPNKTKNSSIFRNALLNDQMEIAETLIDSPKFDRQNLSKSLIYFISLLQNNKNPQQSIIDKILFLINKGADVNYKTEDNATPLMWAAAVNSLDVMQILIENGAIIEDFEENHPSLFANVKSLEAFDFLLNYTNQEILNKMLMSIISTDEPLEFVLDQISKLISKGADINHHNDHGITPLMNAVINGNLNIVKELINLGARCDLTDHFENTALSIANDYSKEESQDKLKYRAIFKYLKTATLREDTKKKLRKYRILSSNTLKKPSLLQDIVCDYLYQ